MKRADDHPTQSFDAALDAGLAAAFGKDERTVGGWTRPPLLRDEPSDYSPIVRPDSNEMTKADPGRYQLFGEIARGGMGVVLKGRDPDLGRDLAVKVLRTEYAGKPVAEQRFVEEAQVGGQLQHPGIVPVYELGRFSDGRPFFTMKLVKGRTLSALLADRTSPQSERGRFLKIFEQVAQTIAYAHSKGVIHRDMKPANVMVGSFGEVQVMDWGLAKVLPQGGVADEKRELSTRTARLREEPEEPTVIRTVRTGSTGSGGETEAGSMLGTPAYMPPEQAGGEMDKLDERADVFGLGAVLCVILTGEPPYVSDNGEKLRLMALRGNLDECWKRLDDCGADADLVTLCKRCLAKEPTERHRHAGEVADAIHEYLVQIDERARLAEMERVKSDAEAKGERKRRKQQAMLGSAVLATCLLGGGLATWQWGRAEREQANTRKALDEVSTEKDKTSAALVKLQDEQARSLAALNTMTDEGLERLFNSQQDITDDQKSFMQKLASLYDEATASQRDTEAGKLARARGYYRVGKLRYSISDAPGAIETLMKAQALFDELVQEKPNDRDRQFERWQAKNSLGMSYGLNQQNSKFESIIRENIREIESFAQRQQLDNREQSLRGKSWYNLHNVIDKQPNRASEAYEAIVTAVKHCRASVQSDPKNLEVRLLLGTSLSNLGGVGNATELKNRDTLHESIQIYESLRKDYPDDPRVIFYSSFAHNNLSVYYSRSNQPSLMLEELKKVLQFREALVIRYPANPTYRFGLGQTYTNLAIAYLSLGNMSEVIRCYSEALNYYRKLVEEYPTNRNYIEAHGLTLMTVAQRSTVFGPGRSSVINEEYFRGAIDRFQTLLSLPGGSREADLIKQNDARNALAWYLLNHQQYESAIDEYRRTISVNLQLIGLKPDSPVYLRFRALNLSNIGLCFSRLGQVEIANRYFARAESELSAIHRQRSTDPLVVLGMAELIRRRAEANLARGNTAAMIESLNRERDFIKSHLSPKAALALRERLVEIESKIVPQLLIQRQMIEARKRSESGLKDIRTLIEEAVASKNVSELSRYRIYEFSWLIFLSSMSLDTRDYDGAERFAREGLAVMEKAGFTNQANLKRARAFFESYLAAVFAHRGQYRDADVAMQRSLQIDGSTPINFSTAALVLALCAEHANRDESISQQQRDDRARIYADRAMGYLRRSIDLGFRDADIFPLPKDELHHSKDYDSLRQRDDFKKLLAEFDASHELLPAPAAAKPRNEK